MRISPSSIDKALKSIEEAVSEIDKASNYINIGQNSLDRDIKYKITGYGKVKEALANSRSDYFIITDKCNKFLNDFNMLSAKIASTTFDVGKVPTSSIDLGLGDGESTPLTTAEFNKIMLSFAYQSGQEMSAEDIRSLIESSDYLTSEDKEYINMQLDLGNERAAMQYIIVKQAKEDLEALKTKNNELIRKNNEEIGKIMLDFYDENPNYDGIISTPEIIKLQEENKRLQNEIKAQERVVNQYQLANKEWEYDYLFKKLDKSKNNDVDLQYEFYEELRDYYFYTEPDKIQDFDYDNEGNILAQLLLNDKSDNSFINWLKSDKCDLENKDQLLDLYNKNYSNNDVTVEDVAKSRDDFYQFTLYLMGIDSAQYSLLSNEEKTVLLNLYTEEGAKSADKFLDAFKQTINERYGANKANEMFTNIMGASKDGIGVLGANWEGVKIGTEGWFARVRALGDKSGVMTGEEYAISYVNSMLSGLSFLSEVGTDDLSLYNLDKKTEATMSKKLADGERVCGLDIALATGQISQDEYNSFKGLLDDPEVKDFLERNKGEGLFGLTHQEWLNYSFNAGVATGTMIPSIAVSIATKGVLSKAGVATGAATTSGKMAALGSMFAYSYSTNKSDAIRNGRNYGEAIAFSLLSASGESISEYFIGGIPFVSKGVDWLAPKAGEKAASVILKTLLNVGAIEPLQEVAQEEFEDNVLRPVFEYMSYGETNYEFSLKQFVDTAITTYLSTLELQSVSVAIPTAISLINRDSVVTTIKTEDGKTIDLTYEDLLGCIDDETGQMSQEELAKVIGEKADVEIDEYADYDVSKETQEAIEKLKTEYPSVLSVYAYDDGECHIVLENGEEIFLKTEELASEELKHKITMLSDEGYTSVKKEFYLHIENVEIDGNFYVIKTDLGDVIKVERGSEEFGKLHDIVEKMAEDLDYRIFRREVGDKVKSVEYDIESGRYIIKAANGQTLRMNLDSVIDGSATLGVEIITSEEFAKFKNKYFGNYVKSARLSTDASGAPCYVIMLKNTIEPFVIRSAEDFGNPEVLKSVELLTSDELIQFEKDRSDIVRRVIYDSESKKVKIITSSDYRAEIDSLSLKPGTAENARLEMYLSEEFNDFYDQMVNTYFPDAKSIEVVDGKYVVTGVSGNTFIVEKGQLSSSELLGNLHIDKLMDKYANSTEPWIKNDDGTYTIKSSKYGDTVTLTFDELQDNENEALILTIAEDEDYLAMRKEFVGYDVVSVNLGSENSTIITSYGEEFTVPNDILASLNFAREIQQYSIKKRMVLLEDGNYSYTNRFGDTFIVTPADYESGAFLTEINNATSEHEGLLVDDWLMNNIENLTNNITPDDQAKIDKQVDNIAKRLNVSHDEALAAINKGLEKVINESYLGNRISLPVLDKILDSRIKNQHETGTSDGIKSPARRRALELEVFSTPKEVPAEDAPIYGMLLPNFETTTDYDAAVRYYKEGPGSFYGRSHLGGKTEAVIIYNDKINENSTITVGDSFDYHGRGLVSGFALSNPQFTGGFGRFLEDVRSISEIENADIMTLAPIHGHCDQYLELQTFGRYAHGPDVIKEVLFLKQPDASLTQKLDSMGISWKLIQ